MDEDNNPDLIWRILDRVKVCMFVVRAGDRLGARPFQAKPDQQLGLIFFLIDADASALTDIEADPHVLLTFADQGGNNYATVEGEAEIIEDRAKIEELWSPWAQAYWSGPEDPRVRLVAVRPDHGHYWDSPNAVVTSIAMVGAAIAGKPPKLGREGEVQM